MRLKDKVAIVTGAGSGMGGAVAVTYAREGAAVVVVDVNEGLGRETVKRIRDIGERAAFIYADVSDGASVKAMVREAVNRCGGVDVLYTNAGIQFMTADARAHELSEEIWDRTHNVDLKGTWLCCKYVIPAMLARAAAPSSWLVRLLVSGAARPAILPTAAAKAASSASPA